MTAGRTRDLLSFVAVSCLCAALLLWLAKDHNSFDTRVYRGAVRAWLDSGDLYSFGLGERHNGFTYPPFAALCMLPMALLPLAAVVLLNQIGIAAALVIAVAIVASRLPALRSGRAVLLVLPVVAVTQPVRDTMTFGQVNITLAAMVLLDLVLLDRGSKLAGIGCGLATAIKLTPGLFIVYLLCVGRWRTAGTAIAVALSATLLAAVVAPGTSWTFWTQALRDGSRVGSYDSASNQSLAGVLARFANSGDLPTIWLPLAVLFAAGALWSARRLWHEGDRLAGLTVVGLTTSVVSPISWVHHFWWVIPALLVMLNAGIQRRSPALLGLTGALTALYVSGLPDLARAHAGHHHTLSALVGENALAIATMLLVIAVPAVARYARPAVKGSSRRGAAARSAA